MHVSQSKVSAGIAVGERFMIESEEMEHGGMEIVNMNPLLNGRKAKLVSRSVNETRANPSARQPHGESVRIMVSSIDHAAIGPVIGQFNGWGPTKLAAPNHQGVFEHPALLQIFEERRDGPIAFSGQALMFRLNVIVTIPRLSRAMPQLNESYAPLE